MVIAEKNIPQLMGDKHRIKIAFAKNCSQMINKIITLILRLSDLLN